MRRKQDSLIVKPFIFKHFIINQDRCAMKVGTDAMILGAWVEPVQSGNMLDIGTGTGILALMLAQRSGATIDAIEPDPGAFLQAKENFENSSWSRRLNIFNQPLQEFAPDKKYDLIISNPPYFEDNIKAAHESEKYKNRKHARSSLSLSYTELTTIAAELLSEKGQFFIILPFAEASEYLKLASSAAFHLQKRLDIMSKADQVPIRSILGFGKKYTEPEQEQFVIYQDNGKYTQAYIDLTRMYYAMNMEGR
jgi:tRNA1Val (adenine37-N6)-methyltransferase